MLGNNRIFVTFARKTKKTKIKTEEICIGLSN